MLTDLFLVQERCLLIDVKYLMVDKNAIFTSFEYFCRFYKIFITLDSLHSLYAHRDNMLRMNIVHMVTT